MTHDASARPRLEALEPGEPVVINFTAITYAEWQASGGEWNESRETYSLTDPRALPLLPLPEPDDEVVARCPQCHCYFGSFLSPAVAQRQQLWLQRLIGDRAAPRHMAELRKLSLHFSAEEIVCPVCSESTIIASYEIQPAPTVAQRLEPLSLAA